MELLVSGFLLLLLLWTINHWIFRHSLKLSAKIPSNKLNVFLGFGKLVSHKEIISYFNEESKKYGPICMSWLGPFPIFVSSDPQILKDVLVSKNCTSKPGALYNPMAWLAGHGLITENDPSWSPHRKLLSKAFHNKVLISQLPIFERGVEGLAREINKSIEKGENIDLYTKIKEQIIKNSSQTILKKNMDLTNVNSTEMAQHFSVILEHFAYLATSVIFKIGFVRKISEKFFFKAYAKSRTAFIKIINESMEMIVNNDTSDPSYLNDNYSVMEIALSGLKQNVIKKEEIAGQILQFFAASFETSGITMFVALTMLAIYPEYQQCAYEEVITMIPDDDTEITAELLDQMTYLEMIFNETLRLFPTVPQVFRQVTDEDVNLSNGLTLPVGQIILIDIFCLHRKPEIWGPNANSFNPDNFLPANIASRHSYSYIPFTKGPRYCVGFRYGNLAIKLSLAKLIKYFKFRTDFKFEDFRFENHMSLKLVNIPQLYMELRTENWPKRLNACGK